MKTLKMFLAGAALLCVSCGRSSQVELTLAGSTSIQPFMEMVGEGYTKGHPGARVVVQGGGSTAGIQAVREGAAAIGMCSRELNDQEKDLEPIIIARDGIAVIVHPSNPVANLTKDQVRDIFAGKVTDWSAVGGAKGKIRPVTREEGSGTRGAFQELVMHKEKITTEAMVQDSNGSVREVIANDPGGIGYMSLGLVNSSVKAVSIGGVKATHDNVKNHTYQLVRPFLLVVKGKPQGAARQFIDYVLSPEGQKHLEEEGLIGAK